MGPGRPSVPGRPTGPGGPKGPGMPGSPLGPTGKRGDTVQLPALSHGHPQSTVSSLIASQGHAGQSSLNTKSGSCQNDAFLS